MEIKVRLHPGLRAQLRNATRSRHSLQQAITRLTHKAAAIVARHGAEIVYAAVNPLAAPIDETGCAMSAFAARDGVVIVDVDPIGTAIGEKVVVWRPRGTRPSRP